MQEKTASECENNLSTNKKWKEYAEDNKINHYMNEDNIEDLFREKVSKNHNYSTI